MLDIIKKALPGEKAELKKNDVYVYSKDRNATKKKLEAYFKSKKVAFASVFKQSKSSSLDVLSVVGGGDVVFKPIIQKGAGGISFEKELDTDLVNFFNGAELSELKHPDVVEPLAKLLKYKKGSKFKVIHEGSKNQKRSLGFMNGNKLLVRNSSGSTLTDITLEDSSNKKIYLSLKMSKSYYTLSASIGEFFKNKDPKTQVQINEFFGFEGQKMAGFGEEFACITKKSNYSKAKANIENVLAQAIGTNMILIHKKKENDVLVKKIGDTNEVSIVGTLNADSYVYPEPNVRKYANIKFKAIIGGYNYMVNFQFRGTTASDVGPKYLRILLERE